MSDEGDELDSCEQNSAGLEQKKTSFLTAQNICDFIKNAPNKKYLAIKVFLIFGIAGGCKTSELLRIKISDIQEHDQIYLVKIPATKINKRNCSFTINKEFHSVVKEYINKRPPTEEFKWSSKNFFLQYQQGKCTKEPMGRPLVYGVPKQVAEYLKLPNPDTYRSNCLRYTSMHIQSTENSGVKNLLIGKPIESLDPLQSSTNDTQEYNSSDSESEESTDKNCREQEMKIRKLESNNDYTPSAKKPKNNCTDKYEEFLTWRKTVGINEVNETTLLAYFAILSNKLEPDVLLATYSTIKTMLWTKEKINIRYYEELNTFLKRNCKNNLSKIEEAPKARDCTDDSKFFKRNCKGNSPKKEEEAPKARVASDYSDDDDDLEENFPSPEVHMSDSEEHSDDDAVTIEIDANDADKSQDSEFSQIKSKGVYISRYNKFVQWRDAAGVRVTDEKLLLKYLDVLSLEFQPSTLVAIFSMLKAILKEKENVDVSGYRELNSILKDRLEKYEPKKAEALTPKNISDFLQNAPDEKYLAAKVILIFNVCGSCRNTELKRIRPADVEEHGKIFRVRVPISKNQYSRTFFIHEEFYDFVKRYINLRPRDVFGYDNFFLNYQKGKCTRQVIGRNKMANLPTLVAEFLKLPNAKSYTGHRFKGTSSSDVAIIRTNLIKLRQFSPSTDPLNNQDPLENLDDKDALHDHLLSLETCSVKQEVNSSDNECEVSGNISNNTENGFYMNPDIQMGNFTERSNTNCSPLVINLAEKTGEGNWLTEKSKTLYQTRYDRFCEWRKSMKITTTNEETILHYFETVLHDFKPSTLESAYAGLKVFMKEREKIDINNFTKLRSYVKDKSKSYEPIKAAMFTAQNVTDFINNAPDKKYLAAKVILIFGISGACKTTELKHINIKDVKEHGQIFCVNITKKTKKIGRSFIIDEEFFPIVKQYINLRPKKNIFKDFFINYQSGKCLKQPIGRNKIASTPKQIAEYLKLPNPERYTSSSFRETSKIRSSLKIKIINSKQKQTQNNSHSTMKNYVEDVLSKNGIMGSSNDHPFNFESCYIKEEVNSSDSEDENCD